MHDRTLICENVCVCVHAHVRKKEPERIHTYGQIEEVKTQNNGCFL